VTVNKDNQFDQSRLNSSTDSPDDSERADNIRVSPPGPPSRHPFVLWLLANARWIWPVAVVAVLVWTGWADLRSIHYRQVRSALAGLNGRWLLVAAFATALNLGITGVYDIVCLRESKVPARRRWWIGTLAFAWSNFLTLGPLAGPAIRFWLYRPAGVSFAMLREAIVSIAVGFSTGLALWLAVASIPFPATGAAAFAFRVVLVIALAFLSGAIARHAQRWIRFPYWVKALQVSWTRLFLLGVTDWMLALFAFSAVLKASGIDTSLMAFGRLFFYGQGIGLVSLIPAGLGSADAFWLSRLGSYAGRGTAGLVMYRVIYYLLPWSAATLVLLRRAVHGRVRWAGVARTMVALLVVVAGIVILISSATPALAHRMVLLRRLIPVPAVVETFHLASVIIGLMLLVLARGLQKGYRDAYRATLLLLLVGAVGNVLKGLDYEEAILMTLTASLIWTHASLFPLPSRPGGTAVAIMVPIVIGILIFTAVGLTAYDGHGITGPFWLHFLEAGFAARFVRSLSAMLLFGLLVAIYHRFRIPHQYVPPSVDEIQRALDIHRRVGHGTNALMVANGDKSIHFWDDSGFCIYRTTGKFMILFSDPSIPPQTERRFMDSLLQRAAELDRTVVFYQVSSHWIPALHDYGYSFFKLGEEAIVNLREFSIQGNKGKAMRNVLNRFRNIGYNFEVVAAAQVARWLPDLRTVSDEWLHSKRMREKQFSIGFFDEHYLTSFPCALVRDINGGIVAFANILLQEGGTEFSVDLMRYLPECPNGVMDLLFLKLFEWGKDQGFETFNLGMAPLATVGEVRQARLAERLAKILFQYGEHWYNFRGLRLFKEKYNPLWVPRYLAYPSPWTWPSVIVNAAVVIAGGWRNVIFPVASDAASAPFETVVGRPDSSATTAGGEAPSAPGTTR
jgi:phosphatidylglycerol lysyltransferase